MPNVPGIADYPTALDSHVTLLQVRDLATSSVDAPGVDADDTTFPIVDTTRFPATGAFTTEGEHITYTGKTAGSFTGCTRERFLSLGGGAAAPHAEGAVVKQLIIAATHEVQNDAIISTQTKLGIGASTPDTGKVLLGTAAGASAWVDATDAAFDTFINAALGFTPVLGVTVQEGDATVAAGITTLDLLGKDFDVTESPTGEANISLANALTLAGITGTPTVFNESALDSDFRVESQFRTHAMFIDASTGLTGFGTNAPTNAWDFAGDGTLVPTLSVSRYSASSSLGTQLIFQRSKHGTIGSHTVVADTDGLGAIQFQGSDGATFVAGARLQATVDGTPATGQVPGKFSFQTRPALGVALIERLSIDNAGTVVINETGTDSDVRIETVGQPNAVFIDASVNRIGFGTNAPTSSWDFAGTSPGLSISRYNAAATLGTALTFQRSKHATIGSHTAVVDTDGIGAIQFSGSDGATFIAGARIQALVDGTPATGQVPGGINIQTRPVGGALMVERLSIGSDGVIVVNENGLDADVRIEGDTDGSLFFIDASTDRVSIGNSSPAVKLDVTGEIRASTAGTNAASVVTVGGTQTLANKTLTSPAITTPTGIVKADVGLGNVDNTADTAKPVSTAQQTALNLKANLASPTFTGTVVLPAGQALATPTLTTATFEGATVINESGADADLRIETVGRPAAIFVDASADSIGFNTTSPEAKLHIVHTGTGQSVLISGYSATGVTSPRLDFKRSKSTVQDTFTTVADNDTIAEMRFFADDGTLFTNGARMIARVEGTPSSGNVPSSVSFGTVALAAGNTLSDRFTIHHDGVLTNVAGSTVHNQLSPVAGTANVFNENGADIDTRFEGDTDPNLFFLDASTDSVAIGNNAPTSWFDLKAGTAARAPLRFPAGTLLTTPLPGAVEYDGKVVYVTLASGNRVAVDARMGVWLDADFTGTDVNTAQPLFPTTADVWTLASDTTYELEASFYIHTTGTASHQLGFLFGGTAVLANIGYTLASTQTATQATIGQRNGQWVDVATVKNSNGAVATASHHNVTMSGAVRVTTGGTFIPQYQWSNAPGAAGVVHKNGWFRLTPVGTAAARAIGNIG